jgi:Spy/CpxP family protein refolding chaperone
MKTRYSAVLAILLFPLFILAQSRSVSTSGTVAGVAGPGTRTTIVYRGELGKWWQNSDIAKKLQLSDGQIAQLDQTFYDHKLKLIDYGADMEKQDLKLQALLDADVPNEGQVEAQVDQVLAARGKLEREFTFMNLDLRKVLSLDQWRQLKAVRGQTGAAVGDRIFFRKMLPPGAAPSTMQLQPGADPVLSLPPLPPPPSDEMY